MKTRLQSLGLLDRALRSTSDDELAGVVSSLSDDHREAIERLAGGDGHAGADPRVATKGRIDGTLESLALVLTDASLADCIEELGDNADNPRSDQLRAVLPGLVERHGVPATRLMLASTLAGEAAALGDDPGPAQARRRRQAAEGRGAPDHRRSWGRRRRPTPSGRPWRPGAGAEAEAAEAGMRREQSALARSRD